MVEPLRPRIGLSRIKANYQSQMMRRNLNGIVDGEGPKAGDTISTGTSIVAPLIIGKVTTPTRLQSLNLPKLTPSQIAATARIRAEELRVLIPITKKRSPVLSVLYDKKTGRFFDGMNVKIAPEGLHPILQKRLNEYNIRFSNSKPHFSEAGSHSEIIAVDKALKAREASGFKVTEADLKDFQIHNEWLKGKANTAPMCQNCDYLLPEIESLTGRKP
jgi:hypothetical protein